MGKAWGGCAWRNEEDKDDCRKGCLCKLLQSISVHKPCHILKHVGRRACAAAMTAGIIRGEAGGWDWAKGESV